MLSDTGLTSVEPWLLTGAVFQLEIIISSSNLAVAYPVPGQGICSPKHLARDIDNPETPAKSLLLEAH